MKYSLILQSFAPLFLLLLIKNFKVLHIELSYKFINKLLNREWSVFKIVLKHDELLTYIVVITCIVWIILSIIAYLKFRDFQRSGFQEDDEMEIKYYTTDTGLGFFMTFVLPLVLDDLGELRDFSAFIVMIALVIILMLRTNLYYQNPVLIILGYTTFSFEIKNPQDRRIKGKDYIGITKGKINGEGIIKYQYIADDVFVIYDKNRG